MLSIKKRVLSFCMALLMLLPISMMSLTPRAQAVAVVDDVVAFGLAYLAASGLSINASNANSDALVQSFYSMWDDFKLDESDDFIYTDDLLATAWLFLTADNELRVDRNVAALFSAFTNWVKGKAQSEPEQSLPLVSGTSAVIDGVPIQLTSAPASSHISRKQFGTTFAVDDTLTFGKYTYSSTSKPYYDNLLASLCLNGVSFGSLSYNPKDPYLLFFYLDNGAIYLGFSFTSGDKGEYLIFHSSSKFPFAQSDLIVTPYSVDVAATGTIVIPDTTTMTDEQSVAISTGIAADNKDRLLEQILQKISEGSLTATATIEGTASEEPGTGEVEKPDGILGFLQGLLMAMLQRILSAIEAIPAGIGAFFTGISDILKNIWTSILSFPSYLQGIWDTVLTFPQHLTNIWQGILDIPAAIGRTFTDVVTGVKTWVIALVVPSEATITSFKDTLEEKLPIVPDLQIFATTFTSTMENPSLSASKLALTPFVNLGRKAGGEYGVEVINFLNFTWYVEEYKATGDKVIVGFFWCLFLWNLYSRLPSIINGGTGTLVSYDSYSKNESRRRDDF